MQYLKADSELGYLDDYTEIELEKLQNLRDSIKCFTFGDYDETGNYVIEDEVVDDLIAMEKYVVEADGNMEFCKSSLKLDKQINFIISYEENKIYLLLIEKLKDKVNPDIEEFNEYVLDEYVVNGVIDRNIIYAKWNVKPFGGYVLDIFSCEDEVLEKYFGIVSRFKYLLQSNKTLLEEEENLEEVEAEYFNDMMELLKRYPKLYDVVVEKMRAFIEVNEELFDETKPWYISHINQLMNYCIRTSYEVLSEIEKVEFEIEQHQLIIGQSIKKAELLPTEKKDNGALHLKISDNLKTVSEIGVSYLEAVKKINETLKPKKDVQVEKITFTKKEVALIKLDKTGIKKMKNNSKTKSTLVDSIVKAVNGKSAGKSVGKSAGVRKSGSKSAGVSRSGGKSAVKSNSTSSSSKPTANKQKVKEKKSNKTNNGGNENKNKEREKKDRERRRRIINSTISGGKGPRKGTSPIETLLQQKINQTQGQIVSTENNIYMSGTQSNVNPTIQPALPSRQGKTENLRIKRRLEQENRKLLTSEEMADINGTNMRTAQGGNQRNLSSVGYEKRNLSSVDDELKPNSVNGMEVW